MRRMEPEEGKKSRGRELIILGLAMIGFMFVMYSRYQNPEMLTPDAIESIHRIAYGFYIVLIAAFGAIGFGLYRYHGEKVREAKKDLFTIIAVITWNKKSRKIAVSTFIGYGIFFSLVSGTLVYQPGISFSEHYGAEIPSGFVAPCCGDLGYMPQVIIYLTDSVGLNIIPINLVLQITVSYLVALNAAIAVSAYNISKKGRGFSTIGAITGLFIACPTCAGTFFSIFVGTASGIGLSVFLTQMQTFFIAISIPVLLVTPFLMAKKLQNADGSCDITLAK